METRRAIEERHKSGRIRTSSGFRPRFSNSILFSMSVSVVDSDYDLQVNDDNANERQVYVGYTSGRRENLGVGTVERRSVCLPRDGTQQEKSRKMGG